MRRRAGSVGVDAAQPAMLSIGREYEEAAMDLA
jgi:hypothetical protein